MVLRVNSTPYSVRSALVRIRKVLGKASVPGADLGRLEIVLAEAMNNIVEHGYLYRPDGKIVVRLMQDTGNLLCEITDTGTAMPGNALPPGTHPLKGADEDLPEGGFGWFMIREVAQVLRYRRCAGRNHLFIQLALSGREASENTNDTATAEPQRERPTLPASLSRMTI